MNWFAACQQIVEKGFVQSMIVFVLSCSLLLGFQSVSSAELLSDTQIIDGLSGVRTRSLKPKPEPSLDERDALSVLTNRGLKYVGDELDATAAAYDITRKYNYPKMSFSIEFEFGSANIDQTSEQQLQLLSKALSTDGLKKNKFVLIGHTDAKGDEAFNVELSILRANAVKLYLTQHSGDTIGHLFAIGLGEAKFKNKTDPFSSENRRVEIINMGTD